VTRIDITDVTRTPSAPPTFGVTVTDDDGTSTSHVVRIDRDAAALARRFPTPEAFVEACFRFLLEREPKESILREFDVGMIGGYFPDWDRSLTGE
jgi:hypothetical protein